ncbi:hypothetical protein KRM28CT15_20450 [Krasilnikovia sp. M28-CT-15]
MCGVAPGGAPQPQTFHAESLGEAYRDDWVPRFPLHGSKTPILRLAAAIAGGGPVTKRDTHRWFEQIHPLQVA